MSEFEQIDIDSFSEYNPIEAGAIIDNNSTDISFQQYNYYSLESLKKASTPVFLRIIREESFESGYSNSMDELIAEIIARDPIIAASWLNFIYLKYNSENKVLLGLVNAISRINNETVMPSLCIMAFASINNQDIEIREAAIRCFENWGGMNSLEMLRSCKPDSAEWIEEYRLSVIEYLEKSLK